MARRSRRPLPEAERRPRCGLCHAVLGSYAARRGCWSLAVLGAEGWHLRAEARDDCAVCGAGAGGAHHVGCPEERCPRHVDQAWGCCPISHYSNGSAVAHVWPRLYRSDLWRMDDGDRGGDR